MELGVVMDQVAARLDLIEGLRCEAHPTGMVNPPGAVVLYPEDYEYDGTYQRGMDRMRLPVLLVVGRVVDRSTRDQLTAYAKGSGPRSVKAVLESGTYTAFDEVTVKGAEFDVVTIAQTDYMSALFTLDIVGQGS